MKRNLPDLLERKKNHSRVLFFFLVSMSLFLPLPAQLITYSFTPCGATGATGPTQAQVGTGYSSTNLNNLVVSNAGIQSFTVPTSGLYRLDLMGASGGSSTTSPFNAGGNGSRMAGDFWLVSGDVLRIVVGQKGFTGVTGSGGGGSYLTCNNVLLIAAGGGGGGTSNQLGAHSTTATSGTGDFPNGPSSGGTNGNGGATCNTGVNNSGGGGGYLTDGATGTGALTSFTNGGGGFAFVNGSTGGYGISGVYGGFGGGGGVSVTSAQFSGGGGGGGYSGGAGGQQTGNCMTGINRSGGGGGGSYNSGTNQNNIPAVNSSDGIVIVNFMCNVNLTASGSNALHPVLCSGQSLTLSTNAASNYNWSAGAATSSIVVSPTVTTTYTVGGTSSLGCSSGAAITVTVSSGTPVITVSTSTTSLCLGNTVNITATGALNYTITNGSLNVGNGVTFTPPGGVHNFSVTGDNGCGAPTTVVSISVSVLPVPASASSTLICSATPATLSASGAASYTWMPGANTGSSYIVNPSANTVYTVTGKQGSCTGTNTVAITTKPLPTLTIAASSTNICNGSTANLSVGGNAVTYTWSTGQVGTSISVTPTTTTLYAVTGTNSVNCTSSVNQVILVSQSPTISVSVSNPVVCSGDASTLTAMSSGSGNSYQWSNGGSSAVNIPTVTGDSSYSVTVTSTAGCVTTSVINVNVFVPSLSVSGGTAICKGANAALSASGAGSYEWSNGSVAPGITVSPTLTTVYTVTGSVTDPVSNIACPASAAITVTVNNNPQVLASADRTAICVGNSAVLTAAGANSYTWTGGSSAVQSATNAVSPIANQTYSVQGTDANGCKGSAAIQIIVSPCTGISTVLPGAASIQVYPNPSSGEFTVTSDQAISLEVMNEAGQLVRTIQLDAAHQKASVSQLPAGIYFIVGKNGQGGVKEKIIIEK